MGALFFDLVDVSTMIQLLFGSYRTVEKNEGDVALLL